MNWNIWTPVFTALAAAAVLIVKALASKVVARINSVPDEKQRRQYNKEEHAELLSEIKRLASLQEENIQLRGDGEAKDKRIASLESKNERLTVALAQRETDKKRKD